MKSNITLFLLLFASNILNASAAPTCASDDKKKTKDAETQTSHQEPCVSNEKLSQLILALESQTARLEHGIALLLAGQNTLYAQLSQVQHSQAQTAHAHAERLRALEQLIQQESSRQHRAVKAFCHRVTDTYQGAAEPYSTHMNPQQYYYVASAAGLPTSAALSQPAAYNANAALAPHATAHSQHHSSVASVAGLQATAAPKLLKHAATGASATKH